MNFLVVDPGLNTGWALFTNNKFDECGIIHGKGKFWRDKIENIHYKFYNEVLHFFTDEKIFIEFPSFQNLVAQNTGSIIKLSYLVGRLYEECLTFEFKPSLINVSEWRGSCPKSVLWRRSEKYFKIKKQLRDHEGDAVSIGHWLLENNLVDK